MSTLDKIDEAIGVLSEGNSLKKLESKANGMANKVNKGIDKFESFLSDYDKDVPGVTEAMSALTNARDAISEATFKLSQALKKAGYETPAGKPSKGRTGKKPSIFGKGGIGFK